MVVWGFPGCRRALKDVFMNLCRRRCRLSGGPLIFTKFYCPLIRFTAADNFLYIFLYLDKKNNEPRTQNYNKQIMLYSSNICMLMFVVRKLEL